MTTTTKSKKAHTSAKPAKEQSERYEVRLSGSGGHGLILAGVMLSQAVGADPDMHVVQTQSYGPEARGGASRADVVISRGEIYYPKTMRLDLLLAFTQEACDKYFADMKDNGLLVYDSTLVTKVPTKKGYGFPFIRSAREQVGHAMVANVIALGAIAELTGIVSRDALAVVVKDRDPKGTEEKNLKALDLGFEMARAAKKK
jgi:2-oxoglutarate ferredoxin oxidoreductase subunit gamma